MDDNEIVKVLVARKKEHVNKLGLKEDILFLLEKESFQVWFNYFNREISWKEDAINLIGIREITKEKIKKSSKEYDKDSVVTDIGKFALEVKEFESYVWHDGPDQYSDVTLIVNDIEVCNFSLTKKFQEYGFDTISINECNSFIDGQWVSQFKEFIARVKGLREILDARSKSKQKENETKELKNKFGITDEEINAVINNHAGDIPAT